MKHLFILLSLLLLLQYACIAQHDRSNRNDSARIIDADIHQYDLKGSEKSTSSARLPFNKISFKDVRYDTSFIAVNWQSNNSLVSVFTMNKKYNLIGGLAVSLTNYINQYYSNNFSNSSAELVCYIKRFAFTLKDTLLEFFNPQDRMNQEKTNTINLEVECYYKRDSSLFPAFRIDTVYTYYLPKVRREFPEIVKEVISPLIQKVSNADTGWILKRKSYSAEQITDRYQSRFNLPILTADSCKKGIYKNFQEFKNNAPSITVVDIKTEKIRVNASAIRRIDAVSVLSAAMQKRNTTTFLYDANDELISPSNIFGFCDGSGYWIQHGAFYYPLIRVDNAFEFMYIYHYADANDHTHSVEILFPLNMENGHID